jgi:hypothetical protein
MTGLSRYSFHNDHTFIHHYSTFHWYWWLQIDYNLILHFSLGPLAGQDLHTLGLCATVSAVACFR